MFNKDTTSYFVAKNSKDDYWTPTSLPYMITTWCMFVFFWNVFVVVSTWSSQYDTCLTRVFTRDFWIRFCFAVCNKWSNLLICMSNFWNLIQVLCLYDVRPLQLHQMTPQTPYCITHSWGNWRFYFVLSITNIFEMISSEHLNHFRI